MRSRPGYVALLTDAHFGWAHTRLIGAEGGQ